MLNIFSKPKHTFDIDEVLLNTFGFKDFRDNQKEIIDHILDQQDVFAVMPTGGGKSLCYQLPAKILEGVCIVVSPLIALMKDQVDSAVETGLNAAFLNSSSSPEAKRNLYYQIKANELDLLYVSPERFALDSFLNLLQEIQVSFIAIDEAHCISEWGHDFRPDFMSLSRLKELLPEIPICAFTATATQKVQDDIIKGLKLKKPFVLRASFNRPNLFYTVNYRDSAIDQVMDFLKSHKNESGIIYRTSRKNVEDFAEKLNQRGIKAIAYHAGFDDVKRARHQDLFNKDKVQIIVATVAFGMGIDKSNIRFVIHVDLPKSMEGYYQETGRAGRDGEPAHCFMLFGRGDIPRIRYLIDQSDSEFEKQKALQNLETMIEFAGSHECRKRSILGYFHEVVKEKNCGACDICSGNLERIQETVSAQKIISAIIRTNQSYGSQHIIDIVSGAKTKKIKALCHDQIKTYGAGKDKPKKFWKYIVDELVGQSFLRMDSGETPTLALTGKASQVVRGEKDFFILKQIKTKVGKPDSVAEEKANTEELFEALRYERMRIAKEKDVPPYIIFSDKTLREMVDQLPMTEIDLLDINGVGYKKMEEYGMNFLKIIASHMKEKYSTT